VAGHEGNPLTRAIAGFNRWFDRMAERCRGVVGWALSHRKSTLALAAASVLFHTILPLEYYSGRYVAVAVGPLLALMPLGASILIQLTGRTAHHPRATVALRGNPEAMPLAMASSTVPDVSS